MESNSSCSGDMPDISPQQKRKNMEDIAQLQSKASGALNKTTATCNGNILDTETKSSRPKSKNNEPPGEPAESDRGRDIPPTAPGIERQGRAARANVPGEPSVHAFDFGAPSTLAPHEPPLKKDDDKQSSISTSSGSTPRRLSEEARRRQCNPGQVSGAEWADPARLIHSLELSAVKFIVATCVVCYLLGKLKFGIATAVVCTALGGVAYWLFGMEPSKQLNWQLEQQETIESLYTSEGETVEWLNFMLERIWRSIDPQFFRQIEGLLEDTIQKATPNFIKGIAIYGLDIGSQAPRVQMIRVFPPLPGASEESIFGEASFSFHAHPAAFLSRTRGHIEPAPPGVSVRVYTAIGAPIDLRGELMAFFGKIRFKIITGPEVPFISKISLAFTSPPTIETAVMPISKHVNIMHIPMMKAAVNKGVQLGLADMVDPRSLTVDVRRLMGSATEDTAALGVVMVQVREAQCNPSIVKLKEIEDSYCTLSLSNQPKKSMSSTRVLTNDKNPRWDESLYVLISRDDVVADTKLDLKVWDADKIKYDDMWGALALRVVDIVQAKVDKLGNITDWCDEERVVFDGWAPLDSKRLEDTKVKLNFRLSFHPKYPTPEKDPIAETKTKTQEKKERASTVDPSHQSGILSVCIQQAMDLEIGNTEELPLDELKHPYNPNQVVSPYAIVYLNDSKVYQTRSKLRNLSPHWNAVSEHFIKDFQSTQLRISVKTSIELERDPVLGTVVCSLPKLFQNQPEEFKETQTWLSLRNGIGFGKVLVTLKYKPVRLTLPRELRGSEVGTLIVDSVSFKSLKEPFDAKSLNSTKVTLALNVDPVIARRLKPRDLQSGGEGTDKLGWYNKHVYFPLIMRYRSALYVHVQQGNVAKHKATGRFWLKDMCDDEWQDVVLGLHKYLSERTKEANRNEDCWDTNGEFGQVVVRLKIVPGFSPIHSQLHSFSVDMVGADPFHDEDVRVKDQKWVMDQNGDGAGEASTTASLSSFDMSTDEDEASTLDENEGQYAEEMRDMLKSNRISKYQLLRKLSWGTDLVKRRVDHLYEGFNSEARISRTVTKET